MDLSSSLVGALRHCRRFRALKPGRSVHALVIRLGLSGDVYFANNLISMYVGSNELGDAHKLFDGMPYKNLVTWGTMVSTYANAGEPEVALGLYHRMLESGSETPNEFVYSAVVKACGLLGDLDLGRRLHSRISAAKLESDTVLMNSLINMYVRCGSVSDARRVFGEISQKTSVSWNTMIFGYCEEGLMDEALSLFHQMPGRNVVSWNSIVAGFADQGSPQALDYVHMMHHQGLELDGFTFSCALKTCGSLGLLAFGQQAHNYLIKSGLESSCYSASALVDMYSQCDELGDALRVFDECMRFRFSDHEILALYNSILSGYVACGHNRAALKLLLEIYWSGVRMNSYTFSSGLKACFNLLNLGLTLQLHALVVASGYELDYIVGSILVDLYAKQGNIQIALRLFDLLPQRDILAWSGLIAGCAKMGYDLFALSLFREMMASGVYVDEFVISCIIKICSSLASIRNGKQVHALSVKSGYELEEVTVTSLIDMYSKCGDIEEGLKLFGSTLIKGTVCWTAIIMGCAQNGRAMEAIKLFYEMLQTGQKPNEVTFLAVLAACRHAGLIEEAKTVFSSMGSEHGLVPHCEHYYCMVDLLGQFGHFEEAEKLISSMPFKPDKTIWCSLLEACASHGKTELVDGIAENLLAISPEDPSIYVMLSNVYATLGMWANLTKVRKSAKKLGTKEAGKSWVEIST
ncbi:pentatricopeptide repeat-containing protein At4g08210 [Eucalyptus grandis]|uniref:pentatricopeptide repeat-containing protein At4g08210 n=1 Tax=Eucalyptus grandis TaxID=71139 RepID=UPI00192E9E8E|nr:pentatricopeptide repeat-containing protein At4g08210 [Eucalyptus grandis]XP_039170956.1 pentatricopeptide repeat-containing protein At4g08210 [Eucalyptus grandis]XP_039170957.1 pentatricopeptide repeat-containing protein At4g08210 [Eucalyptus grandis]XP_039170958.1 pentatricopeptide repeat-containing protein At4g08210 [Eucalyptus grandis]